MGSEATTPAGCWGVRGKAEICFNTFTTAQTPVACSKMFPCYCRSQERCWDYPESGTERCSVSPMNVLPTGARVAHLFKDNENLDEPVVAVSKWTLPDDSAWRRNLWIHTMRVSVRSAKRETGLKVFKWGSDVFDENTFWAYQVWNSKREYIAYCTTGALRQVGVVLEATDVNGGFALFRRLRGWSATGNLVLIHLITMSSTKESFLNKHDCVNGQPAPIFSRW